MFTGIVERTGAVIEVSHTPDAARMTIDCGPLDGMAVGDSIAVNGVCLTAVEVDHSQITLDVVSETLSRSNLGGLGEGDIVNLERAMVANGRFDGHIVQGHVDGVGEVVEMTDEGDSRRVSVEVPPQLIRFLVEKGSITVDGVSLTVAALSGERIQIALIPHTLANTTLGLRKVGETVNLEVDILAKYVERLLSTR